MTSGAEERSRWSRKRKILSYLVLLLTGLVVLEFGWRVYLSFGGHGFFDDPNRFTSPFFTTYEEPRPSRTPEGFLYDKQSVPREKAADEVRIICFGGSTTANRRAGISFTEILQEEFADAGRRVRVLNAGGDGFSTAHTLVNLSLRNLDVEPDIIVVYHNINDLSAVWFERRLTSDYAGKYKSDTYLGLRHRTGLVGVLTKVSRLARFIVSRIPALKFPTPDQVIGRDHTLGLRYFTRNLRSIHAVARAHGVRMLIATQPARSGWRSNPGFVAYNQAVRDFAKADGIPIVDLAAALTDDALFVDDLHYTRGGVEFIANEYFEPLKRLVREVEKSR